MEDSSRKLVSINISPGFKHADPNKTTFLERASEELWTDLVKEMVESEVNWQLITSYNEWGGLHEHRYQLRKTDGHRQ